MTKVKYGLFIDGIGYYAKAGESIYTAKNNKFTKKFIKAKQFSAKRVTELFLSYLECFVDDNWSWAGFDKQVITNDLHICTIETITVNPWTQNFVVTILNFQQCVDFIKQDYDVLKAVYDGTNDESMPREDVVRYRSLKRVLTDHNLI
jgi:hypothetical protein